MPLLGIGFILRVMKLPILKNNNFTWYETLFQAVKYSIVGILQNVFNYFLYLILVSFFSLEPVLAISICYPLALSISFLANRKFTFKANVKGKCVVLKYIFVNFIGYLINFLMLIFFYNELGYSYQLVQFFSILVVAVFLFSSFKLYVYK